MAQISVSVRLIFLAVFITILLSTAAWATPIEVVLYSFCQVGECLDGAGPSGELIFDADGNLYGTTSGGGAKGGGTVFELSPSQEGWTETVLYSFCALASCADGETPEGALIFDSLGNIYGTTYSGGAYSYGTVFELSPSQDGWTETVLYSFCAAGWPCADYTHQDYIDVWPYAGVAMDREGNLFGKSEWGSTFELIPSVGGGWTKSDLYFTGDTDTAGVSLDATGNVYSMADGSGLGQYPGGYVFELFKSAGWAVSPLFGFVRNKAGSFADGYAPNSTPVFDKAGNLYGTTNQTGKDATTGGTAFKLTPGTKKWGFKLLHTFTGKKGDGLEPLGTLAVDSSGNVYGTTYSGGAAECSGEPAGCGTVFEISPKGTGYTETVLWSFDTTDGRHPTTGVILDKAGNLYGTTYYGGSGTWSNGVVFEVIP